MGFPERPPAPVSTVAERKHPRPAEAKSPWQPLPVKMKRDLPEGFLLQGTGRESRKAGGRPIGHLPEEEEMASGV